MPRQESFRKTRRVQQVQKLFKEKEKKIMNSMDNVLQNFEWDYDGTVGFARGEGYKGAGISRTMFLHPQVADIPEQLFAVKQSQSTNPQKAGKLVFKYLSYRLTEEQKPIDLVPSGIDMTTPLDQIKAAFVTKINGTPGASVSLNIGLKGKFTNIVCADGNFKLYDEDEPDFKTDDPKTTGNAPYYIKNDAQVHVKLKGAMSKQGNAYIQSQLSSTAASTEIFAMPQRGAVWSPDGNAASTSASNNSASAAGVDPVW